MTRYRWNLLKKEQGYLVLEPATLTSVTTVRQPPYRLGHGIPAARWWMHVHAFDVTHLRLYTLTMVF